jgi:pilus assembly protein CpaC
MPLALAEIASDSIVHVFAGRSSLIYLNEPLARISVSDPKVADVTVINSKEIYILGKVVGSTSVILWNKAGKSTVKEIQVGTDLEPLKKSIKEVMPDESDVHITTASGAIVLTGSVANAIVADQVNQLSDAFIQQLDRASRSGNQSGQPNTASANTAGLAGSTSKFQLINLLKIRDPQQVLLEVKIAEISKELLEQMGVNLSGNIGKGSGWAVTSAFSFENFVGASINKNGNFVEARKDDTLYKILAEPSIVAMSGQEGSFLVGGKIYMPLVGGNGSASTTEISYGIGLKFLPTVLDKGRINLKISPEVSTIVPNKDYPSMPNISTKTASTTVQIREGETLVIGGLLSSDISETVSAFPILGEIPIIGALFRSKSFDSKQKELVVIVTPSMVSSTTEPPSLPTDQYKQPSRSEFFLDLKNSSNPSNKESDGR